MTTTEYHKINAPFMRDRVTNRLISGDWCLPELGYLATNDWEFTEKVDGTNIRIEIHRHEDYLTIKIKGRTDNAQIPKHLMHALNGIFGGDGDRIEIWPGMKERFLTSDRIGKIMLDRNINDLVIYGEGYGPKINGGGNYATEPNFVVFDVKVGTFWLLREAVNEFCGEAGLDCVPVLGRGSLYDAINLVRTGCMPTRSGGMIKHTSTKFKGLRSMWGDFEAEGVIAVPTIPLFDRAGRRIITKIKAKDFNR